MGTGSTRSRSLLSTWKRYVAPTDDGTWNTMLKPGATGYGIVPWVMDLSSCECGGHPLWEVTNNDPFHGVSFVSWTVPLDTSEELAPGATDGLDIEIGEYLDTDDVTVPVLSVTDMSFPDMESDTMATLPQQGPSGTLHTKENGNVYVASTKALLPIWAVTPVGERMWRDWRKEVVHTWINDPAYRWLKAWDRLNSPSDWIAHDGNPLCFGMEPDDEEAIEQASYYGNAVTAQECHCSLDDLNHAFIEFLDTRELTHGVDTDRAAYEDALGYCLDRFDAGWRSCAINAIEGDEASIYYGSHYSPFWTRHVARACPDRQTMDRVALQSPDYSRFINMVPLSERPIDQAVSSPGAA